VEGNGALLDGFPRTAAQAEALEAFLAARGSRVDACVLLEVPDSELLTRLSGRRVCRKCGRGWHVTFSPPPAGLACDACGGEIYQRDDDSEATIKSRLKVYHEQTAPLVRWYGERNLLRRIDGLAPPDEVGRAISLALA
jgi:adenylate kinase